MTRHLHAVAHAPVTKCRHADGRHGKCGGPSNGRECWDHAQVGRLVCCEAGTCEGEVIFTCDCSQCGGKSARMRPGTGAYVALTDPKARHELVKIANGSLGKAEHPGVRPVAGD